MNVVVESLGVTYAALLRVLAFLALSVIPALQITDWGLVDVARRMVVLLAVAGGPYAGRSREAPAGD